MAAATNQMALIDSPRWTAMPPMADAPIITMAAHMSLLRTVFGMSPPDFLPAPLERRSAALTGPGEIGDCNGDRANDSSKPQGRHHAVRRGTGYGRTPGKRGRNGTIRGFPSPPKPPRPHFMFPSSQTIQEFDAD